MTPTGFVQDLWKNFPCNNCSHKWSRIAQSVTILPQRFLCLLGRLWRAMQTFCFFSISSGIHWQMKTIKCETGCLHLQVEICWNFVNPGKIPDGSVFHCCSVYAAADAGEVVNKCIEWNSDSRDLGEQDHYDIHF